MKLVKLACIFSKLAAKLSITERYAATNRDLNVGFSIDPNNNHLKPSGLWYSFGSKWLDFINCWDTACNDPIRAGYERLYHLKLNDSTIFSIRTPEQLAEFRNRFEIIKNKYIDWSQVKKAGYAGVEIMLSSAAPKYLSFGIKSPETIYFGMSQDKWERLSNEEREELTEQYEQAEDEDRIEHVVWLDAWSLDSGCIWDSRAIINSELLFENWKPTVPRMNKKLQAGPSKGGI